MQAVVIDAPGDVSLGEVPDPVPCPEEIVVAVRACGICGTDLHITRGEFSLARYPLVPGHEFAGEVVAVGSNVTGFRAGMMVTADPNNGCGRCRPCREGHENLCADFTAIGITRPGAGAEFVAVPSWRARVLPADFNMAVGALVEPLSCAVHGYDLIRSKLGDNFLIYGAGTMGLLLVALAARAGAISVTVVEPNEQRRELARSFGATRALAAAAGVEPDARFEVVIDATGVVGAIEDALQHVQRGGHYQQFGVAPAEATATFSPYHLYNDELSFNGSMAVLHSFDRACDIALSLDIGLERLVSDMLPLNSYDQAFERVRQGSGLKVQFAPGT